MILDDFTHVIGIKMLDRIAEQFYDFFGVYPFPAGTLCMSNDVFKLALPDAQAVDFFIELGDPHSGQKSGLPSRRISYVPPQFQIRLRGMIFIRQISSPLFFALQ